VIVMKESGMGSVGTLMVLAGVGWLMAPWSVWVVVSALLACLGSAVWSVAHPASFGRVAGPVRGRVWRSRVKSQWFELTESCRLGRPRVRRSWITWPHVRLVVRPEAGQTLTDYEAASEALQLAVGAARLRVEHHGHRDLLLTFTVGDELRRTFDSTPGEESTGSVVIGRTERGGEWRLALGPHTLVAGCSGSGKGSVFWSLVFGLAPSVKSGRVQLHGIDLKGGMEILMGEALFTSKATDEATAVASLERLVALMRDRNASYAGRLRSHTATADEPLHVVMIDELAALTAYCSDRDTQRRAERAINLLCSQGRASGFVVFACLQDPRKEVIPSRGLFTQMVGLRLKDLSETAMVLGDVAVQAGAYCHRIPRDVPGTGYVVPEDGTPPVRVRAGFASDEAIRSVAARFPAPESVCLEPARASRDAERRSARRSA
jgi:S-DNA-T family DNA segregation ATPase FtsK/SpoIIIE